MRWLPFCVGCLCIGGLYYSYKAYKHESKGTGIVTGLIDLLLGILNFVMAFI